MKFGGNRHRLAPFVATKLLCCLCSLLMSIRLFKEWGSRGDGMLLNIFNTVDVMKSTRGTHKRVLNIGDGSRRSDSDFTLRLVRSAFQAKYLFNSFAKRLQFHEPSGLAS